MYSMYIQYAHIMQNLYKCIYVCTTMYVVMLCVPIHRGRQEWEPYTVYAPPYAKLLYDMLSKRCVFTQIWCQEKGLL